MTRRPPANRYVLRMILLAGMFLPTVTLIPLGGLWLWQHGLMIYWVAAALVCVAAISLLIRWLFPSGPERTESERGPAQSGGPEHLQTPAETAAWAEVRRISQSIETEKLATRTEILALGEQTIRAVATSMHPGTENPELRFTVPEGLAIIERVSGELRGFVLDNVPFGDRLTLGQAYSLWGYRSFYDSYQRLYDVWRVIRLINPMTALAQEAREQLTKQAVQWGKDQFVRRVVERYVEEVGRAAIDLYSGQLRVTGADLAGHVSAESKADRAEIGQRLAEPLRFLIAGQVSAGKSSLVNALTSEVQAAADVLPTTAAVTPYTLSKDGLPAALLLDSPGFTADPAAAKPFLEEARRADLILWVTSAARADREPERRMLEAIRARFAAEPLRKMPPVIVVLSQIDRLKPAGEWSPPYDLGRTETPKVASIRGAVEAVSADLGVPKEDIVPVCLSRAVGNYNLDTLWAEIIDALPEARSAQLVRAIRGASGGIQWGRVLAQAIGAGRVLSREALGTKSR